jgi:hypothetical protein
MSFDDLIEKWETFRVGTNRADLCWEMKSPPPYEELDILNEHAEKLELELDETENVGYLSRKPFHTNKVYRILFNYK